MKRVIINNQIDMIYKGKKCKIPAIILAIVGILKRRNAKKWDSCILITGKVGSAKSTMAQGIGGLWEYLHNRELSLDNFTWSSQGVVNFIDAEGNDCQVIIYDEAVKGGTGRDSLTKIGNQLKIGLVVGRRKRHLYIMIVDELLEFSKKIISRSNLLIDMRTLLVRGEEERGYFKIYNEKELKEIYWLLKEQKIRYISEYNARIKPFYVFKDFSNVFIDEKEYEDKKIEETRQQDETAGKINWSEQKVKGFYLWSTTKKKQIDIADTLGIHRTTINSWIRDFKKYVVD